MEFKHVSVLYEPVLELLNVKADGTYLDGTLGGGGHADGVCAKLSAQGVFIGIDRDKDALAAAEKRLERHSCRKFLVQSNYEDVKRVCWDLGILQIDGALLDLGVSSFQLDNPQRGFSYMQDAPLDMRMNAEDSLTAETVVNVQHHGAEAERLAEVGERCQKGGGIGPARDGEADRPDALFLERFLHRHHYTISDCPYTTRTLAFSTKVATRAGFLWSAVILANPLRTVNFGSCRANRILITYLPLSKSLTTSNITTRQINDMRHATDHRRDR